MKIAFIILGLILFPLSSFKYSTLKKNEIHMVKTVFYPQIQTYLESVKKDFNKITDDRKQKIKKIADFIKVKKAEKEKINLLFICTHNSRRSHMSQIWSAIAAEYYGVKNFSTFSGGTEVSDFNPRAVSAIERAGFLISKGSEDKNPVYEIKYADNEEPIKAFSKRYDDPVNPHNNFCAIMTCSQADKACPFVNGAIERISIPYDDPKAFDGTAEETEKYDKSCKQIAAEMMYLFSLMK